MGEGEGRRKPWAYSSLPSTFCICFPQNSGNCCLVFFLEGKAHKAVNGSSREEASNLDLTCELLGCTIHARKAQESVQYVRSNTACPGEKGKGRLDLESLGELSVGSKGKSEYFILPLQVGGLYFTIALSRSEGCLGSVSDLDTSLVPMGGVVHDHPLAHNGQTLTCGCRVWCCRALSDTLMLKWSAKGSLCSIMWFLKEPP